MAKFILFIVIVAFAYSVDGQQQPGFGAFQSNPFALLSNNPVFARMPLQNLSPDAIKNMKSGTGAYMVSRSYRDGDGQVKRDNTFISNQDSKVREFKWN